MGVKMSAAIYNGSMVKLNNYKDYMKDELTCVHCGVPISHVVAHKRMVGDREISIPSYFRLKDKSQPHKDMCEFITSNAIEKIIAGISDPDLYTKDGNKFIARLHIIIDEKEDGKGIKLPNDGESNKKKPTQKYIKGGDKPAYLSTMKKIIQLRKAVEDKKELKDLITLQFYNSYKGAYDDVKWKDFYIDYDDKDYRHAYNLISSSNKPYHPMCFAGTIKSVELSDKGTCRIKLFSTKIEENEYVSLVVLSKKKEVYEYAKENEGKSVVIYGCGHHDDGPGTFKRDNKIILFHNISTWINVKTQLFVFD